MLVYRLYKIINCFWKNIQETANIAHWGPEVLGERQTCEDNFLFTVYPFVDFECFTILLNQQQKIFKRNMLKNRRLSVCIELNFASLWVLPVDSCSIIGVTYKLGLTPLSLNTLEIFEYSWVFPSPAKLSQSPKLFVVGEVLPYSGFHLWTLAGPRISQSWALFSMQ